MIRKILTIAIPLLAPTIAYMMYLYFTAKNREDELQGRRLPEWRRWPWVTLVSTGAALTALTIALLGLPGDEKNPGAYIPPHMEDGKIVPGGFKD
ncbi:DUF6111 family protein [Hwanghaeella sp.]|uniref:DUF6111 family protein n=1 Tax=Hwanghaeella sp. TaxID=2605943 RepID=UPI003CCBDEF5